MRAAALGLSPYDSLVEQFDPGSRSSEIAAVFADLKRFLDDVRTRVIETGRKASGTRDIRCTISIGGFVPKPHTPFQWAAQADPETIDRRLHALRDRIRADKRYGRAIGMRYHDGKPGMIEGLLSRGDRRVGDVIEAVWRDGGHFDGWSEHDGGGIYFYNDDRRHTPWGDTRPDYGRPEVRGYILDNARYWVQEYHLDGLSLDMST